MKPFVGMKQVVGAAVVCAVIAVFVIAGTALATPGTGVESTLFAVGTFDQLEAHSKTGKHKVHLRTKGASDVHILQNRIAPGGTFGWHSHPGPSIVVVKSGALTLYHADDPSCTPHVVTAGSGFVDHGGAVHVVRNEGSVEAVVYVTSIIPHGAERRIDQPAPGNCTF